MINIYEINVDIYSLLLLLFELILLMNDNVEQLMVNHQDRELFENRRQMNYSMLMTKLKRVKLIFACSMFFVKNVHF